jgi:hypothetical protein
MRDICRCSRQRRQQYSESEAKTRVERTGADLKCRSGRPISQHESLYHTAVLTLPGFQATPDKQLAALGAKRTARIRVQCFGAALQCLAGTDLALTFTSGMSSIVGRDPNVRLVKAPRELRGFHFLMAWHPMLNTDPRHTWLRGAIRLATEAFIGEFEEPSGLLAYVDLTPWPSWLAGFAVTAGTIR